MVFPIACFAISLPHSLSYLFIFLLFQVTSRVIQYISPYLFSWQSPSGVSVPWWFSGINKPNCEVLQTWKCQQKNIGYNTSDAFFPNKIISPPVCFSLVTTTKPHLNHHITGVHGPVCAANREGIIKQLFVEHMSMFQSLWLLLSRVIALLSAGRRGGGYSHVGGSAHL